MSRPPQLLVLAALVAFAVGATAIVFAILELRSVLG
jgi:hypothetical protein